MALPAGEGLSVMHVLADEWMWRRDVLTLLGAQETGRLDTILGLAANPPRRAGGVRQAQVSEFVAGIGGELVGLS